MGQFKTFDIYEEERRRRLYCEFVLTHRDTLTEYSRALLDYKIEFIPELDGYDVILEESPQSMGN